MDNTHYGHSLLLKYWRPKVHINRLGRPIDERWRDGEPCVLESPLPGYTIRISFAKYPEHPEWTRVIGTNWRCEDEPNGVIATDECRALYRKLVAAGFVRVTP
jgi:hypothetical protein